MSMFNDRRPDSRHRPRNGERQREVHCPGCGYRGLAVPPAACPKCDEPLSIGSETLTKTDYDNDLFK